MAKKSKALSYVKYGAIALSVVGLIMTLLLFVQFEGEGYTGLQVIFGHADTVLGQTFQVFHFSFMCLLTVLLPLIGSLSVLCKNKIVRIVGAVLMLVGTIFCFLVPNFIVLAEGLVNPGFGLGVGAILAGVLFGLGTLCNVYAVIEE